MPVSIKGVLLGEAGVVLLENERGEWELPGGRPEEGEGPRECLRREMEEELRLRVEVGPYLDTWTYEVHEGARVLIVTYGCFAEDFTGIVRSVEHTAVASFRLEELRGIDLPWGYERSIRAWYRHPVFPGVG